jgi:hypothetical protein
MLLKYLFLNNQVDGHFIVNLYLILICEIECILCIKVYYPLTLRFDLFSNYLYFSMSISFLPPHNLSQFLKG